MEGDRVRCVMFEGTGMASAQVSGPYYPILLSRYSLALGNATPDRAWTTGGAPVISIFQKVGHLQYIISPSHLQKKSAGPTPTRCRK
jgi:hypothetical protein